MWTIQNGRVISDAVKRQLFISKTLAPFQGIAYGICGEKLAVTKDFLQVLQFSLPVVITSMLHVHVSSPLRYGTGPVSQYIITSWHSLEASL